MQRKDREKTVSTKPSVALAGLLEGRNSYQRWVSDDS